jgi:hypothetical protein
MRGYRFLLLRSLILVGLLHVEDAIGSPHLLRTKSIATAAANMPALKRSGSIIKRLEDSEF